MITIHQIKCDDGIFIRYTQKSDDGFKSAEHTLKCYEQAEPNFYEAIKALNKFACQLCELPETYLERLYVTQINFKYKDGGDETAVLKASMTLFNSDNKMLELKTPEKLVSPFDKDQKGYQYNIYMPKAMEEALEYLKNQAIFYIRGVRAQMSLLETA